MVNVVNQSITRAGCYEPFALQASRGQITNHSVVSIFGYQSAVSTTFIPIWENATAYTYPTSAVVMTLASTSASDVGASVLINGLDASYNAISETITFTGGNYTGASTTKSYFRINSMSVTAVPVVGTSNVGTITLKNGGTTYAQIAIGVGRTQMAIYTVPNGSTFYLDRTQGFTNVVYTSGIYATYRTAAINANGVLSVVTQYPLTSNFTIERLYPHAYGQKTDIQWQMVASTGPMAIGFAAQGILVSNDGTI